MLPFMFVAVVGCVFGVAFIFVDISSTAAQPTFGELLGERRVGGGIYCAVRGCGCICESVIEAPGSPMTGLLGLVELGLPRATLATHEAAQVR